MLSERVLIAALQLCVSAPLHGGPERDRVDAPGVLRGNAQLVSRDPGPGLCRCVLGYWFALIPS